MLVSLSSLFVCLYQVTSLLTSTCLTVCSLHPRLSLFFLRVLCITDKDRDGYDDVWLKVMLDCCLIQSSPSIKHHRTRNCLPILVSSFFFFLYQKLKFCIVLSGETIIWLLVSYPFIPFYCEKREGKYVIKIPLFPQSFDKSFDHTMNFNKKNNTETTFSCLLYFPLCFFFYF